VKDLAGRGVGCSPDQIHRSAFMYGNNRGISHPWGEQKKSVGEDWFAGSIKKMTMSR